MTGDPVLVRIELTFKTEEDPGRSATGSRSPCG